MALGSLQSSSVRSGPTQYTSLCNVETTATPRFQAIPPFAVDAPLALVQPCGRGRALESLQYVAHSSFSSHDERILSPPHIGGVIADVHSYPSSPGPSTSLPVPDAAFSSANSSSSFSPYPHSRVHTPSSTPQAHGLPYFPPPPLPSGVRPFACDMCALSFNRKHDLKRHQETHSGENPFLCNGGCGKTFTRKDALKRHQVRPSSCRIPPAYRSYFAARAKVWL